MKIIGMITERKGLAVQCKGPRSLLKGRERRKKVLKREGSDQKIGNRMNLMQKIRPFSNSKSKKLKRRLK